jgi:protein-disulfide isomerase
MKRYIPFLIVGAVAILTVGGGMILYRAKRVPALTSSKSPAARDKDGTAAAHALGNADAPVTLEEFGDFQCPPCGMMAGPIHQLEQDYHGRLRIIFRNFPLAVHAHAREAAQAAEAAGLQGHFWEMHGLLYREQAVWSKAPDARSLFNAYAGILGLDLDRFKKDIDSPEVKLRVTSDEKHGVTLGVVNTPTIFINGNAVAPSSLNPAGLRSAIDQAMNAKSPPSSS